MRGRSAMIAASIARDLARSRRERANATSARESARTQDIVEMLNVIGADGGTRTRTRYPGADFKSAASTFSPRPRAGPVILRQPRLADRRPTLGSAI